MDTKISISHIPPEGMDLVLKIPPSALKRLEAELGGQKNDLDAKIFLQFQGPYLVVEGRVQTKLEVPCHRCLDGQPFQVDEQVRSVLAPEENLDAGPPEKTLSGEDLNISFYTGDQIDLTLVLEEELLLLLPETLCGEDADKNCLCCGRPVEDVLGKKQTNPEDHPFFQMKTLLEGEKK